MDDLVLLKVRQVCIFFIKLDMDNWFLSFVNKYGRITLTQYKEGDCAISTVGCLHKLISTESLRPSNKYDLEVMNIITFSLINNLFVYFPVHTWVLESGLAHQRVPSLLRSAIFLVS